MMPTTPRPATVDARRRAGGTEYRQRCRAASPHGRGAQQLADVGGTTRRAGCLLVRSDQFFKRVVAARALEFKHRHGGGRFVLDEKGRPVTP